MKTGVTIHLKVVLHFELLYSAIIIYELCQQASSVK
jgi:hypothetical protein